MKIIVMTGVSSGIGRVAARRLTERGHRLVGGACDIDPMEAAEIRPLDLSDLAAVRAFAGTLDSTRIDSLVLNAGVQSYTVSAQTKQGFERTFGIRLKFPVGYAIPAHSHPTDENVVVVSGALTFGMGDKLIGDDTKNKTLTAGGFALMPAGMNHYAFTTTQETTIVLYGQGPVEIKYVNPADDPRNAGGTK
jgi:NAD(P)-dependent dehydrogenase (short-subunit alcohol dehydrogenase family)